MTYEEAIDYIVTNWFDGVSGIDDECDLSEEKQVMKLAVECLKEKAKNEYSKKH